VAPTIGAVSIDATFGCLGFPSRQWVTVTGSGFDSSSRVFLDDTSDGTGPYEIPSDRLQRVSSAELRACAGVSFAPEWGARVVNGNLSSNSFSFTVGPSITTGSPANMGSSTTTVTGTVLTSTDVTVIFDYGTTSSYGSTSNTIALSPSSSSQNVSTLLSRLGCQTTYHYRLRAVGFGSGTDRVFATGSCADIQAPTIGITTPSTNPYATDASTVALSGTASDNVAVSVVSWGTDTGLSGIATGTSSWTTGAISLLAGDQTISVSATDQTGNVAFSSVRVSRTVSGCTVRVIDPAGGEILLQGEPFTIRWELLGNACGTMHEIDVINSERVASAITRAAQGSEYTWTVPSDYSPGSGYMVWVFNFDGSSSDESEGGFTITGSPPADTEPPTVEITSPSSDAETYTYASHIAIGGMATDAGLISRVFWERTASEYGDAAGISNWSFGPLALGLGKTSIKVFAEDAAGNRGSDTIDIVRVLRPPSDLVATATGTNRVQITWAGTGVDFYDVYRWGTGIIARTDQTTFEDAGVLPGNSYFYQVRAATNGYTSEYSNPDVATTVSFSDEPLVPGMVIRALHWNELARAIDIVRGSIGLPQYGLGSVSAGTTITASHVQTLQVELCETLLSASVACTRNLDVFSGHTMKASHIQELRDLIR